MNKKIVNDWIAELKKFSKQERYNHLLFPMFMEGSKGPMYSPEGILCEMHLKAGLGKWLPEKDPKSVQLRSHLSYDGSTNVAPDSVLKWVGISGAKMSEMRRANGENGIEAAISYIESLVKN